MKWQKTVVHDVVAPNTYVVKSETGVLHKRNRKHLRIDNGEYQCDFIDYAFTLHDSNEPALLILMYKVM